MICIDADSSPVRSVAIAAAGEPRPRSASRSRPPARCGARASSRCHDPRHLRSPVLTSGPGTSLSGPNRSERSAACAASGVRGSARDSVRGSTLMPALAAAERDVGDRALPGHPRRQRRDLLERDVGVEADPALAGPRAMLCWTRKPSNMRMVPSSIHHRQPLDRGAAGALEHVHDPGSSFSRAAASSNCRSAFSTG